MQSRIYWIMFRVITTLTSGFSDNCPVLFGCIVFFRTMKKIGSVEFVVWRVRVRMVIEEQCYIWHVLLTLGMDYLAIGEETK